MAIINNNVQNVKFLRNGSVFTPIADPQKTAREVALESMNAQLNNLADGTAILGRYQEANGTVKTLVGFAYVSGATRTLTVFDVDGASADVEALRQEINAKLGEGITSDNTATAQLAALSGGTFVPGESSSANTSVEGAKAYAYDLLGTLDYEDAAVAGQYVSQVTQSDGKIAVVRVELPSSADTAVAKKFVTAVAEDKGQIVVSRGEISSSAETMVLTDNSDGGVNFEVNIDNETIIQDSESGKLKVADTALVQYVGDEDTIHISAVDTQNNKTVSSLLTISATTPTEANVKEQYNLVGANGNTIGATIKIYKDSSLYNVYLGHMDDAIAGDPPVVTPGSGDTALCFIYHKEDGSYQLVPVNVETFLEETEFESGVTATNHIVHGVVDPQSEKDSQDTAFLTVGADGFKISGIKGEIDRKLTAIVEDLDADESGSTEHIKVNVVEANGVITTVTVEEDNIANANDLAALSAKTVTNVTSTNGSIDIATANTSDSTVEVNVITDANKIKMSGFTPASTASSLNNISEDDSIATAFEKVDTVITDLDGRLDKVEGEYISGITVNGSGVTVSDNVAALTLTSAPSTGAEETPIIVETSNNGGITLKFDGLDCGFYA